MESVLKEREDDNPKHIIDYQILARIFKRTNISVSSIW